VNRSFLLVLIGGLLLGIVLHCWQVSLAAFNGVAGLKEPVRLWAVERTGVGVIELEFLGKKWLVTFPDAVDNFRFL